MSTLETVSTEDNLSSLWDLSNGTEIAQLYGHRSDTHGGTFSHDGRLVATVSVDGTARLWDGITGRFVSSLGEEFGGLKLIDAKVELVDQEINAAFSPDDQFLAAVSMDGGVRIWDIETPHNSPSSGAISGWSSASHSARRAICFLPHRMMAPRASGTSMVY